MSKRSARHSGRQFITAILAGLCIGLAYAPAEAAERLVYRVHHPRYGDIGTYSNVIEKDGDITTVTTDAEIKVGLLGIVLYRQNISRVERWDHDRLVSFHGVTTVNGRPFEVDGAAEGDSFKIVTPMGDVTAPGAICVANPWSDKILMDDVVLTPDKGTVENVQVGPAVKTDIAVAGSTIPAKEYKISRDDGQKRYDVWLDDSGKVVMFDVADAGGTVTFSLMT